MSTGDADALSFHRSSSFESPAASSDQPSVESAELEEFDGENHDDTERI